MSDLEIFMRNIKWLRQTNNLTQREMASRLNISVYSLAKLEKGELPCRLSVDLFFAIEEVFGLPPAKQFDPLWISGK